MAGLLDERLSNVEQRLSSVEQRLTADSAPVVTVAEQRIEPRRDHVPDQVRQQPDQATGEEELLTTAEAAERMGLAFSTLNAAKTKGYIPYRASGWEAEPTDQRRGKSALWRVRPIGPGGD